MLQTINHAITRRSSRSLLHWKILKQNCSIDFLMDVIFYLVLSDLFIKINSFMLYYLCYNNVKIIRH